MRISLPNSNTFSKVFFQSLGKEIDNQIKGIATDSREDSNWRFVHCYSWGKC